MTANTAERRTTRAYLQSDQVFESQVSRLKMTKAAFFLVGLGLCFTGIGAILGVPLMIYSFFIKFPKEMVGIYSGACPHCDTNVMARRDLSGFDCPTCKRRIVRQGDSFVAF